MFKRKPEILLPLIQELETHIAVKDKRNKHVSSSDVAWQIDHSLKVFNLVCETLINSDPKSYSSTFKKWRTIIFTLGFIPRGRVQAPKFVRPPEVILEVDLRAQIKLAYSNIKKLESVHKYAHFKHFIFGVLNKNRTIKFLKLHTSHHLKIIRDILK